MTDMRQMMQVGQAARLLGVARKTVQRWAEDGTLPVIGRVGDKNAYLFDPVALEEFAKARIDEQQRALDEARSRLGAAS